jgi:hypothetical protein
MGIMVTLGLVLEDDLRDGWIARPSRVRFTAGSVIVNPDLLGSWFKCNNG